MTDASHAVPSCAGRQRAARGRERRRLRILATAPAGWSDAAIGGEAATSRQWAPQIVAKTFDAGESETTPGPGPSSGAGRATPTPRRTGRSANRRGRP